MMSQNEVSNNIPAFQVLNKTTPQPAATSCKVQETAEAITLSGAGYTLRIARTQPTVDLSLNGRLIASLNVASGLDTVDVLDEQTTLGAPELSRRPDAISITWRGHSARWAAKEVELHAWADGFSYEYRVQGQGTIDRAHLLRTRQVASQAHDVRLFNPEPNSGMVQYSHGHCEPGKHCVMCFPDPKTGRMLYTGPADYMTISAGRDKDYHDGNWFFTPSPFCYAVEGAGNWLSLGVVAQPGAWDFSEVEYPGEGFGLSLVYDGHITVDGEWQSPQLICLLAADEYSAVQRYCDWLRIAGLAPDQGRGPVQAWWREPIFCGWGEQVSEEVHTRGPKAPNRATQANYRRWLSTLAGRGLNPGTVAIDDKWQRAYGLNDVDTAKWPDMHQFIAEQHRQGRHVLLWLKAWDPEGVPAEECILDETGVPVTVDPGNPAYQRRLAEQVRWMLQDLGADGFKIDFTHLIPRGLDVTAVETLNRRNQVAGIRTIWPNPNPAVTSSVGGHWGLELMRQWLQIISDTAKAAKPDALVITHTANPYLADLVDMLRLNDVAGMEDVQASIVPDMRHRARVARAASPYWLIDSDNWPCSSRVQWRDYIQAQASGELGVPSLYHAERLGWCRTDDALQDEDYEAVRVAWDSYRAHLTSVQS